MQDLSVDPNKHGLDKWDPAAVDEDAEEEEDDDGVYLDRSEWACDRVLQFLNPAL